MAYKSEKRTRDFVRALNKRLKSRGLPTLKVQATYNDRIERAGIEVAELMGVRPFKGSAAARRRREDVILGASRTSAELQRAKAIAAATKAPRIVVQAMPGNVASFGALGAIRGYGCHYTYGPRDTSLAHAKAMNLSYARAHIAKGWGSIGYHVNVTRDGVIIGLRPVRYKGAHIGGHNTGLPGIMVHGTTGTMTFVQYAAIKWYLENSHTTRVPASMRTPVRLAGTRGYLHRELFPTSCPGSFDDDYLRLAGRK